jgi:hypothetical protein
MEEDINSHDLHSSCLFRDGYPDPIPEPPSTSSDRWDRETLIRTAAVTVSIGIVFTCAVLGAFTVVVICAEAIIHRDWPVALIVPGAIIIGFLALLGTLTRINNKHHPKP